MHNGSWELGAWTKVATNVTAGQIHKLGTQKITYLSTYRDTGGSAPTLITEGVEVFRDTDISTPISAAAGIDVYIWPVNATGSVRVDV